MKPTKQQLTKINNMAQRDLTEDEVYVFRSLMVDDLLIPDRYIKIHESLLRTCVIDANKCVPLLLNHDTYTMPVGKVIEANLQEDVDSEGNFTKTVYGYSYIVNGKNTQHGVTTTDISSSIDDGTLTDVSVGISFNKIECSICHNDLRDWRMCEHVPGKQYINVNEEVETCIGIAGVDGKGGLRELSLVYSGACPRASVVQSKDKDNDEDNLSIDNNNTILSVMDLKNTGVGSEVLCNFSKNKTELYVIGGVKLDELNEKVELAQDMEKETEDVVEQTEDMNSNSIETSEDLSKETSEDTETLSEDVETLSEDVETLSEDTETLSEDVEAAEEVKTSEELKENKSEELAYTNSEVETLRKQLEESQKVIDGIKSDLMDKTSKSAIRLMGNTLPKGVFDRFLKTLSIDELKETLSLMDSAVTEKFSAYEGKSKVSADENLLLPKFETSLEENNFFAEKAEQYRKENPTVSVLDSLKAVKAMYK